MRTIRTGVLGGTFDPIHSGHLRIALETQRLFGLSRVYFAVAASPPHKTRRHVLPLQHRYAMICLATADRPRFLPSLVELEAPASPYSIDTMVKLALSEGLARRSLYFVAGSDSLPEVTGWRESRRLLSEYNFVFVSRPGFAAARPSETLPADLLPRVADLRGLGGRRLRAAVRSRSAGQATAIYLVDLPARNVSSSRVRALASAGRDIRRLVPGAVRQYIKKLHLYGDR